MSGTADSGARGCSPWVELLTEFARLPAVVSKLPPKRRSHRILGIAQHPVYLLMEQLVADLTLVYSPPKVGSATISATVLQHPSVQLEPEHIHCLSPDGLAFLERQVEQSISEECAFYWRVQLAFCRWAKTLLSINRALRAAGMGSLVRKPFLIAGVREPVAQYLSMIFHFSWAYVDTPQALTADFVRARMADDPVRRWHDNWFRDELGQAFGVDVYSRPFPTDRGWDIYENDDARILVIRQESMTQLPNALGALYGVDPATFEVETRNTASDKDYGAHYGTVKQALRLSEQELEEVYSQPYVRHFYAPGEIEAFKRRWRASADNRPQFPSAPVGKPDQRPRVAPTTPAQVDREPARGHTPAPSCQSAQRHSKACRPCEECVRQLRRAPFLEQACAERLALIQRLDTELKAPRSIVAKCRSLVRRSVSGVRRIFQRGRAA